MSTLNSKIVATGALLLVVAAAFFLLPGGLSQFGSDIGLSSAGVFVNANYVVRISPGNYSSIRETMGPDDALSVTIEASPPGVDFFLMNGGNFSAWTRNGGQPSQVYPQSMLNVKNYSFAFVGSGKTQDYYLVLTSRSSTELANVLLHLTLKSEPSNSLVIFVPITFLAVGALLVAVGVRVKRTPGIRSEGLNDIKETAK